MEIGSNNLFWSQVTQVTMEIGSNNVFLGVTSNKGNNGNNNTSSLFIGHCMVESARTILH